MKLLFKIAFSVVAILTALYCASFYILPSVKIVNNSGAEIAQAKVTLPSSQLDFGSISSGESNTLHYSLSQQHDGVYTYEFFSANSVAYRGSCGYVTSNEINKRVVITVQKGKLVTCN
ncbi:hypothetical protein FE810_05405 [Thalassotalea litorea]|uniref:Uncharacterized protein n=1 Tax=Thalassotalea litorea TaxID=2020715 RepID=A0A5R9IQ46_9GAMM|nr:hypothetical protein [Thalassotalea litorea]TLU66157.1 hypothetical protein FE810_05405 [Thalassotalea litorea]